MAVQFTQLIIIIINQLNSDVKLYRYLWNFFYNLWWSRVFDNIDSLPNLLVFALNVRCNRIFILKIWFRFRKYWLFVTTTNLSFFLKIVSFCTSNWHWLWIIMNNGIKSDCHSIASFFFYLKSYEMWLFIKLMITTLVGLVYKVI